MLRGALALIAATGWAQLIAVLSLPILLRLYSDSDFGSAAIFGGLLTPLGVLATGQFHLAIATSAERRDAVAAAALSVLTTCVGSLACLVLVGPGWEYVERWGSLGALGGGRWALPVSLLAVGLASALQQWTYRDGRYRQDATARVTDSTATVLARAAFGSVEVFRATGLILGSAVGFVLRALLLALASRSLFGAVAAVRPGELRRAARVHRRYPAYTMGAQLLDAAVWTAPIWLLAGAARPDEIGQYWVANTLVLAPLTLLGAPLQQMLPSRLAGPSRMSGVEIAGVFKLLLTAAFALALSGAVGGVSLVPFLLGDGWRPGAEYVSVLFPGYALWLVAGPARALYWAGRRQRTDIAFQMGLSLSRIAALAVGLAWGDLHDALVLLSVTTGVVLAVQASHALMSVPWFGRGNWQSVGGTAGCFLILAAIVAGLSLAGAGWAPIALAFAGSGLLMLSSVRALLRQRRPGGELHA